MFDLLLPVHPSTAQQGFSPVFAVGDTDLSHPFVLTLSRRAPTDLMSCRAAPLVLARFATLADAMLGAINHAEGIAPHAASQLSPPGRCRSLREAREAEEGRGIWSLSGGERSPGPAPIPSPFRRTPMNMTEPTLAPPMAPSTVDTAQIFAAHSERAARIEALRPGNKDRLFDGLMAAGITHVTVTFDGAGDSGQIESLGAWSGETAVDFLATEIAYAGLTWDDPEVEMRQLSLEDVVEQLAYDFLSDTHDGWENNDGAWGEFCFDAAARCIHLEFNERFTSSELTTHDF
jgi:hypothetical protein